MAFLVEAIRPLDFSRLYFSLKNKNKIAFYFVLFSFIRISGFAEDTITRQCKTKKSFFILYCTRLFVSLQSRRCCVA